VRSVETNSTQNGPSQPTCDKCGSTSFDFREVYGPLSFIERRRCLFDKAIETYQNRLNQLHLNADNKNKLIDDWEDTVRRKAGERFRAETEAIANSEQSELRALEMNHQIELQRGPVNADDPAAILLGSPEEQQRDRITTAGTRRSERRRSVHAATKEKHAELKAELKQMWASASEESRRRRAQVDEWLANAGEAERTWLGNATQQVEVEHPLKPENLLYVVYCSDCGHVVGPANSPGRTEETLTDIRTLLVRIERSMAAYMKGMASAADAQHRARLLQLGLQGLNQMLHDD
jgi:hypothetical protein